MKRFESDDLKHLDVATPTGTEFTSTIDQRHDLSVHIPRIIATKRTYFSNI